jgi:type II secretion system protein N
MGLLKNKTLWFVIYGILITFVFLYLLFPSDIAKSRLEDALNSSGLILKSDSLRPSLPCGLKMKNAVLTSAAPVNTYLQGESLDLQFNPISFFRKSKIIGLSGKAYGGRFDGTFVCASFSRMVPPQEGKLKFQNIDLGKYTYIKTLLGREITGKTGGSFIFKNPADGNLAGTIDLLINGGTFALAEPFLGLNRLDFKRAEIQARIKNGSILLEKMKVSGQQIDCFLNGEITLADDLKNSQLNLKGELVIAEKKARMNINISGTLSNPVLRYM